MIPEYFLPFGLNIIINLCIKYLKVDEEEERESKQSKQQQHQQKENLH